MGKRQRCQQAYVGGWFGSPLSGLSVALGVGKHAKKWAIVAVRANLVILINRLCHQPGDLRAHAESSHEPRGSSRAIQGFQETKPTRNNYSCSTTSSSEL